VSLSAVAFTSDGRDVATFDGSLRFFDASTLAPHGAAVATASSTFGPEVSFPGVAFGTNGEVFTAGGTVLSAVDARSRTVMRKPLPIAHQATDLALSRDGRLLAVGDTGGGVTLVDVASWSVRSHAKLHVANSPVAVGLSPDGAHVVSGGGDGRVVLRNTDDAYKTNLAEGKGPILGLHFSGDGKFVAVGFGDGRILIIDVATHAPVAALVGHDGVLIDNVVFSADNQMLAATTEDGVVLWDVGTQQRIGVLDSPSGRGVTGPIAEGSGIAYDAAFSPDSKTLVTTWGDNSIITWNLDVAAWTQRACDVAGRNLTHEEWRQNLGDQPYRKTCSQWPPA
jgi:WD40 repeat protein